jgi:GNAT superfamily N-acetyltransferase
MVNLVRTTCDDHHFLKLVRLLDADLAIRDGEEHAFYSQFNKLDNIRHVVVAYEDGEPAGCGAIKEYAPDTMEVKRMFVMPAHRRKGIAAKILKELETRAAELSYKMCILETGKKQPEAIELYRNNGYQSIPNYGQYAGVENSVCFIKQLIP